MLKEETLKMQKKMSNLKNMMKTEAKYADHPFFSSKPPTPGQSKYKVSSLRAA